MIVNFDSSFFLIIDTIKNVTDKTTFHFKKNKLTLTAMDSECVSFVFLNMDIENDEIHSICVSFKELGKIPKASVIQLEYETDFLIVRTGSSLDDLSSEYKFNTYEDESQEFNMNEPEYSLILKMPFKKFKKIVTTFKKMNDSISFKALNGTLEIFNDVAKERISVQSDLALCVYPIKYLMNLKEVSKEITLFFYDDESSVPLKLSVGPLSLFVAPKMTS